MIKVSCHIFRLSTLALLLLFLLAIPAIGTAASLPADAIGEVVYLVGSVSAQQPTQTVRELDLESPVYPEDTVVTHKYSQVEIRFKDGTILAQSNDATISLNEYVYSTDASASKLLFQMTIGTFRIATGHIVKQNPEGFELQTPQTSLGIRGTQPFIRLEKGEPELVGVIEVTPGYTVEVTSARQTITFDRGGFFTEVDDTGGMSAPAPTPPDLQRNIQRAAPMTSRGELGSRGSKDDTKRKVKAFKQHVTHEKESLDDHSGGHPDYGSLHRISVKSKGLKNAIGEKEGRGSIESGGSVGTGHPDDDGHPDGDDHDHGDDHGDGGGGH